MPLDITVTDAGRAAIVNAENSGTDPVLITEVGFGSGQYAPTASQTTLNSEIKRLSTIKGGAVAEDVIHVTINDDSADTYSVGEIGLYTDAGVLFAVYSQTAAEGWIVEKATVAALLVAVDITFTTIDATNLTFGDTNFSVSPATTTERGIVELATIAEATTGTDTERAVTPAGLAAAIAAIAAASTTVKGLVELATVTEATAGTDTERAVTPAGLQAALDALDLDVASETAAMAVGSVGSYAYMQCATIAAPGGLVDRNDLIYSGSNGGDSGPPPEGSTWRCMGDTVNPGDRTLFLRVS